MQRHTIADATLREVAQQYGTPCWVYDADRIRGRIAQLKRFGVVR
jgi:diaminopimelate decarboxylase